DEVHQRTSVHGPEELGVGADRHHGTRELARDACLDESLVRLEGVLVDRPQLLTGSLGELVVDRLEGVRAGLADLAAHVLALGHVEVVRRLRIAHGKLIERIMNDNAVCNEIVPLSCNGEIVRLPESKVADCRHRNCMCCKPPTCGTRYGTVGGEADQLCEFLCEVEF